MNGSRILCGLILSGALVLVGCEKEDQQTPSGTPTPVPQATEQSADEMKASADKAADETKDAASRIGDAGKKQLDGAAGAIKSNADAAAEAAATDPAAADAVAKIKQATDYIGQNKLELAETTLSALEKNKTSLPASVQSQLTNARTMLDVAKKRGGTTTAPAAK